METKDEKVARLLKRPSSVTGAPLGSFTHTLTKLKCGLFFAPVFYDTLRYAKKVSEPPPRYIMTGGARLAFSDTHKHHTYRKI